MNITTRQRAKHHYLNAEQFKLIMKLPGFDGATIHETLGPNWRHLFIGPQYPRFTYYYVVRGKLTLKEVLAAIDY